MSKLSTAALLVIIAAQVLADLPAIVAIFVTPAIVAAPIVVGGAFLIGYALGGPTRESKEALGLGTSQGNIGRTFTVPKRFTEKSTIVTGAGSRIGRMTRTQTGAKTQQPH